MILDEETNLLFLSELILQRTEFVTQLKNVLSSNQIPYQFLPGTKDIWCRDYMPIQVSENRFLQFKYDPTYLNYKKYRSTITNVDSVCDAIDLKTEKSEIKIDGGNVIKGKDWVILTDRIFSEKELKPAILLEELEKLFEAKPIIIPAEPGDYLGHADGVARRLDEEVLIVNEYSSAKGRDYSQRLEKALKKEGFKLEKLPNAAHKARNENSADGYYINYLQMRDLILLPVFGHVEDETALKAISSLFSSFKVATIDARAISIDGGVLNCISWSVFSMKIFNTF